MCETVMHPLASWSSHNSPPTIALSSCGVTSSPSSIRGAITCHHTRCRSAFM